ncbi:MAG: 3-hydroxyisobutyrate dehydrogenase [Thermoleophilia bacterium]
MGAPMTKRLVEHGHSVRAWNRTRAKAEGLGAEVAATPAEAVAEAQVVITMLADGPAVRSVMEQALPALASDAVWLQMSTVGVAWADRLASLAAERGIALVDAPVMGSRPAAEEGSLLPLASGPPAARARCQPALEAISRRILWLGDEPGLGSRLKVVLNLWIMTSVANLAECLALAEALRLDPRLFLDGISGAPFDMQYAHWKGEMMLKEEFPAAFALRLAQKDVGLALEAAGRAGLELALARATHDRFGQAIAQGHDDEDFSAVYLAVRRAR